MVGEFQTVEFNISPSSPSVIGGHIEKNSSVKADFHYSFMVVAKHNTFYEY